MFDGEEKSVTPAWLVSSANNTPTRAWRVLITSSLAGAQQIMNSAEKVAMEWVAW
jgi:hypothetical protein